MKFKVGDLVKGTNAIRYSITNTSMTCGEVLAVDRLQDIILVKILEHKQKFYVGDKHWVHSEFFELVETTEAKLSEPDFDSLLMLFEEV